MSSAGTSSSSSDTYERVLKTKKAHSKNLESDLGTEASGGAEVEREMTMSVGAKRKRKDKKKGIAKRGAKSIGSVGNRSNIAIKVDLENDMRRIVISPEMLSLARLTTVIKKTYKKTGSLKPGHDLLLKYMDDDGDWMTITDDTELTYVIKNDHLSKLKVCLQQTHANSGVNPVSREDVAVFASSLQDNVNRLLEGMAKVDGNKANQLNTPASLTNSSCQTDKDGTCPIPEVIHPASVTVQGRKAAISGFDESLRIPESLQYNMYTGGQSSNPQQSTHPAFSRKEGFTSYGNSQQAVRAGTTLMNQGNRGHTQPLQQFPHIGSYSGSGQVPGSSNPSNFGQARLQHVNFGGAALTTQSTYRPDYRTGGYPVMGGAQGNGDKQQYGGAEYTQQNQTYNNSGLAPRNHN